MGKTAQSRLKPAQNGTGSRLLQCTPRRRTTALPLRTSSLPRGLLRARVCGRAYCGACMSLAGPALRTSSLPRGFLRGARLWPYLRSIPLPFPPLLLLQFSSLFSCIFLGIFLRFFLFLLRIFGDAIFPRGEKRNADCAVHDKNKRPLRQDPPKTPRPHGNDADISKKNLVF